MDGSQVIGNATALRGVATVRLSAADLEAATRWYAEVLGVEAYFQRPGYVEFRFGDDQVELGIVDQAHLGHIGGHARGEAPAGVVVYFAVDDVEAALARLVALGARAHEPVRQFGEGFVAGSVVDPFGNVIGLMVNDHYGACPSGPSCALRPWAGSPTRTS
jgi:predicted enzyme related to lactoylglutathione lyase